MGFTDEVGSMKCEIGSRKSEVWNTKPQTTGNQQLHTVNYQTQNNKTVNYLLRKLKA